MTLYIFAAFRNIPSLLFVIYIVDIPPSICSNLRSTFLIFSRISFELECACDC